MYLGNLLALRTDSCTRYTTLRTVADRWNIFLRREFRYELDVSSFAIRFWRMKFSIRRICRKVQWPEMQNEEHRPRLGRSAGSGAVSGRIRRVPRRARTSVSRGISPGHFRLIDRPETLARICAPWIEDDTGTAVSMVTGRAN